jgi:4-amino-4-deoxy-L-arabinose transferase-like glycosyltransferase
MQTPPFSWLRSGWCWTALLLFAVYLRGLFLDVMDVDASQYASIAREMLDSGAWLQVMHRGADYLDKPPLLFWTSAGSFLTFGFSNWAYKLPSLLAAAAAVYAVFRFSLLFYPRETARNAAWMLASALGLVVICNDVRTDTLLLGATACSVWLLAEYLCRPTWWRLAAGFACIGVAMLAKGPIGLLAPGFAVGAHLLLHRDWRNLFRPQWLAGLLLAALLLVPMCWGLYQQFDLHPEKIVNDRTGVSGLRFYFWEQSFGRITGENVWKNDASVFYFLHVYLWAFLPWAPLLYWAVLRQFAGLARRRLRLSAGEEGYSLGAFLLSFIALSLSQYKLPHYIFVTLPWAAVLAARGLDLLLPHYRRWIWGLQYAQIALLAFFSFLIPARIFPDAPALLWAVLLAGFGALAYAVGRCWAPADSATLVRRSAWSLALAAFVLNFYFYPRLLPYQSSSTLAARMKEQGLDPALLACYKRHGHALDFYTGVRVPRPETPEAVQHLADAQRELLLYTTLEGKKELDAAGLRYDTVLAFQHFQVALLNAQFLNPSTRPAALTPVFLLKIRQADFDQNL